MFAWGSTVHGELGIGGIEDEHILIPRAVPWHLADQVTIVACGANHTLLLTDGGKVFSCGSNDYGQLGHDLPRKRPQPVSVLDAHEISMIACGSVHSVALNRWGRVFTWGSDAFGQCGHELAQQLQTTPRILRLLTNRHVVQIASGSRHSVALTSNGELYCWGANSFGQLGIGTTTAFETKPMQVSSLGGVPIALIACGGYHTFAVSKSGAVFGWGKNSCGQLGINDTDNRAFPCQLRSLRNIRVRFIACGDDFSAFLTLDGGVFTCGAGQFGQLGHGSQASEMLPRKVVELMGSTITQLQCGRQHTLAFVPSRNTGGRLYSFGLGGAGQLGVRKSSSASTPQVVLGPWLGAAGGGSGVIVASGGGTFVPTATDAVYSVCRVFAGGDHCFALVMQHDKDSITVYPSSYDLRDLIPSQQLLIINAEYLAQRFSQLEQSSTRNENKLTNNQSNTAVSTDISSVPEDFLTYIETVFGSLACMNGSFLQNNERHYYCTSRHHGVDLTQAGRVFEMVAKLEKGAVKDMIWTCISETLLPQLTVSPPDVEALRIYLTLCLYHEFSNAKQYRQLHAPFANHLLALRPQARRVVAAWWQASAPDHFERLVDVFKGAATFILTGLKTDGNETITLDHSLCKMLETLQMLNKLNHSVEGLKIPYDTFHIPEVHEYYDIVMDYIHWLGNDNENTFFLCNYPFIFDAHAKMKLLQTDQAVQMQVAMQSAAQQTLLSLFNIVDIQNMNQFLFITVSRENIVSDTIRELYHLRERDLKKPLRVKFVGEEAEDGGGVQKEFFMLVLREILDPKYGMFQEYEETRAIWFSENSFEDEAMYGLIGIIFGLVIYNFRIINVPFPLALYRKLLDEPLTLADLRALSPTMANSLQSLLDYQEPDFQDVFDLNFDISRDVFGEMKTVELKPDGGNIAVTSENKKEYVDLYMDYILNRSVSSHYHAFYTGFMKVCGGRVLQLFHAHELMAVVIGNENYDWHALEEAADYRNGYRSSDPVIRWFWEVLHEMSIAEKKKFLLYLTGSDRIPIQGMKAIKITIQPTNDEKYLPVAHTCFNLLDLPRYRTKERLKYKLLQAIQHTEGFSIV